MKRCSVCKEYKNYSDFRKHSKSSDGLQSQCKACACKKRKIWMQSNPGKAAEQSRLLRAKNPDKHNEFTRKWRKNNPDKVKANTLKKRYKITLEQWNEMFHRQAGRCLVCEKHQNETSCELAVDHCHKTGIVRGLLCVTCNRAIGLLSDSPVLLKRASDYLLSKPAIPQQPRAPQSKS